MEPHAAFVGAKCIVELDTVAVVDMDTVFVIQPFDFEADLPVWGDDPFDDIMFDILRVFFDEGLDGGKYLFDRLKKRRIPLAVACSGNLHGLLNIVQILSFVVKSIVYYSTYQRQKEHDIFLNKYDNMTSF